MERFTRASTKHVHREQRRTAYTKTRTAYIARHDTERHAPLPSGLSGVLKMLVPDTPAMWIPFRSLFFANFCHDACFVCCSFAFAARTSSFFSFFFFFRSRSSSSAFVSFRFAPAPAPPPAPAPLTARQAFFDFFIILLGIVNAMHQPYTQSVEVVRRFRRDGAIFFVVRTT